MRVTNKKRSDLIRAFVPRGFSKRALGDILNLQQYLPEELRYPPDEISADLRNPKYIHLFLYNGNAEAVGYVFGIPHNEIVDEMRHDDPLLKNDDKCYYIDQVIVVPSSRGGEIYRMLLIAFFRESNRRGCFRYSAHVLSTFGFDKAIKRFLRRALVQIRPVKLPSFGEHDYVYMEAEGGF